MVDSAHGPLRGRNEQGLREGDSAILFVRPESLRLANGSTENTFESTVTSEAFEGAVRHLYLKGDGGKKISLSMTNEGKATTLSKGESARVSFAADRAVALPEGELASE